MALSFVMGLYMTALSAKCGNPQPPCSAYFFILRIPKRLEIYSRYKVGLFQSHFYFKPIMSPTPQGVIAVAIILPSFATVAVVMRFYVHRTKRLPLQSDVWTILVAMVL